MIGKMRRVLSRFGLKRFLNKSGASNGAVPVNFREHDLSPEQIQQDVEYAYRIGKGYLRSIEGTGLSPKGLRFVEFGPGINFGSALYLACHGAEASVADRFPAPWHTYHERFYKAFLAYLAENESNLRMDPLEAVIRANAYPEEVLKIYPYSLEEMSALPESLWEVTFSNAVFEHLFNPEKAFFQLARLTASKGMGFHQVDHRDHRDFSRPWEFLLLSDKDFKRMFESAHGECGNRVPKDRTLEMFQRSGFQVLKENENMFAEDSYLKDFLPRLHAARNSSFKRYSADALRCISCHYTIQKK